MYEVVSVGDPYCVPYTLFSYQGNKTVVKKEQLTGGPGRP